MIYTSRYPDVAVIDELIHERVLGGAARRGSLPAVVDAVSGRTITYGELATLVERLAAGLAAEGIRKGDVVALHSPNTIVFPVVFYATTRAGGTVTTLSPLATPEEMAKQLIDSDAKLVVSVSAVLESADAAVALVRRETGKVVEVLVCDEAEGHRSVMRLLGDGDVPEYDFDPAVDVAVLPYSSGTTGTPKGVMLTHRNICTNLEQLADLHRIEEGDRIIAILPFFHIYGMAVLLNNALFHGATVYVHPRFDLGAFLTSLERDKITHAYVWVFSPLLDTRGALDMNLLAFDQSPPDVVNAVTASGSLPDLTGREVNFVVTPVAGEQNALSDLQVGYQRAIWEGIAGAAGASRVTFDQGTGTGCTGTIPVATPDPTDKISSEGSGPTRTCTLPTPALFLPNEAALIDKSATLTALGDCVGTVDPSAKITVEGHTAAVPGGDPQGAVDLSTQRATEVAVLLQEVGVPAENITSVVGLGDAAPLVEPASDPGNRAVVVTFTSAN